MTFPMTDAVRDNEVMRISNDAVASCANYDDASRTGFFEALIVRLQSQLDNYKTPAPPPPEADAAAAKTADTSTTEAAKAKAEADQQRQQQRRN